MPATLPPSTAPSSGAAVWRMLLALVIGLVVFPVVHAEMLLDIEPTEPRALALGAAMLVDVGLGTAALIAYPFRHRRPLLIVGLVVAASAVSSLAIGTAMLAVVSIATRRRWGEIAVVGVIFAGSAVVGELVMPNTEATSWGWLAVGIVAVFGILVLMGMNIGGRRQLRATIIEKANSARREQAATLEQAKVSERARIAREMHDVLAHRLSLVALHAGALEYRTDLTAKQQSTTAGIVRENAHLALTELREVLGVLRDPGAAEAAEVTHPQPTLANLADLLADSRTAGTPATLSVAEPAAASLGSLPDSTSRHLYRIIQEGLTNARKHAPGQSVSVSIGGEAGARLSVSLTNAVAGGGAAGHPSSGLGLPGLAERVRLAGGELTAGVDQQGAFTLAAWVPWTT